ncbi:hypothetical protein H072_8013 [Dactylellina haptotyla CBS 200.50]|uniref:Uncharacterized protein n=1 Tax=Dactylellina haptotyla (strain CBS 200.50) TaxID=1284197 RepID=S8AAZ0_DACHA|nr:hypothetical protein H072_8013 [Dactylellina haptotyla CBS 200.50]
MAAAVRRKALRPPLRKSATTNSSSSSSRGISGIPPPTSSAIAARDSRASAAEVDPLMAASFLPFCSYCEKQIVIPNNGILYCSEACKKRDRDIKPHPIPICGSAPIQQIGGFGSWNTPPLSPRIGYIDTAPPNLIAPTSPTSARSIPMSRTVSNPNGGDVSFSPPSDPIPLHRRSAYEISYPSMSAPPSPTSSSGVYLPSKRPHHLPRNNTFTSVPSLTNSPGTSVSSHGQYNPYQATMARPLPPIHNPYSYSFSSSPRSIDLVTPISSITSQPAGLANTSFPSPTSDQFYEKKILSNSEQGAGQGSLKKLFNFEGMRAPPQPMRSSPMASRAASPAPMMSTTSRSGSPTPGSVAESTKLRSTWTDIY